MNEEEDTRKQCSQCGDLCWPQETECDYCGSTDFETSEEEEE